MRIIERARAWWAGPAWTDKVVAFLTLAIVAVGIAQTIIFKKQWQEMHSGGVDTHDLAAAAKAQADEAKVQAEQAKIQAEKATESADYMRQLAEETLAQARATNQLAFEARKSAQYAGDLARTSASELVAAEETAHNDQRAWFGIQNIQLSTYKVGQPIKITVNLSNAGKSPALQITYSSHVNVFYRGESPPFAADSMQVPTASALPTTMGIAPVPPQGGYQLFFETGALLTQYAKDLIDSHSRFIWAWGTVRYSDIFNSSHFTEFCGYTAHLASMEDAPSEGMLLKNCPSTHNDMN